MPRLQLLVYRDPGQVEVFLNIRLVDGIFEPVAVIIDTGAQNSLLPAQWLERVDTSGGERQEIRIGQAGIARQSFTATQAVVTVFLEDLNGNRSEKFATPMWFAGTDVSLIGFGGILERTTLHLDLPNLSGYLDI
jgi:hypothetical protein